MSQALHPFDLAHVLNDTGEASAVDVIKNATRADQAPVAVVIFQPNGEVIIGKQYKIDVTAQPMCFDRWTERERQSYEQYKGGKRS